MLDFSGEAAIGGVIFQKMSVCFCIGQIVDCDDFKVTSVPLKDSLERLSPNAPKAVNTDASCHSNCSPSALNRALSVGCLLHIHSKKSLLPLSRTLRLCEKCSRVELSPLLSITNVPHKIITKGVKRLTKD